MDNGDIILPSTFYVGSVELANQIGAGSFFLQGYLEYDTVTISQAIANFLLALTS